MKQYRKNRIRLLPTESSTTSKLSQSFLKSIKKNIINQLKIHWEIFLSTYQYSKKDPGGPTFRRRVAFEYFSPAYGASVDLKSVKRYSCAPMSFQGTKYFSSEARKGETIFSSETKENLYLKKKDVRERNFFYLKQEKFSSSNYFILAKIVDLIGAKHCVQNRFRQLIKINTKYLELEKLFQIKVFKNTFLLYWISYLLIEQIYQFIKMNSLFLYQAKGFAPFGPVWGKKNKIEIQNNENFFFLKCKDFLMLKWYQNKIHTWCEAQILNKKTSFNQFNQGSEVIFAPTSHIRTSIFGKGCVFGFTNTISYSQEETNKQEVRSNNLSQTGCCPSGKMNNLTKVSNGLRQRYLRLIKKIIQKSKVTTQLELIQKLNEIIGALADTFIINNINKRSVAIKVNRILYQFLWRWGLIRHRKQKAKWIKNRYWSLQ